MDCDRKDCRNVVGAMGEGRFHPCSHRDSPCIQIGPWPWFFFEAHYTETCLMGHTVQGPCIVYGRCSLRNLTFELMVQYDRGQFQLGNRVGDFLKESFASQGDTETIDMGLVSRIPFAQGCLETGALRSKDFKILNLQQQLGLLKCRYLMPYSFRQPLLPPYTWLQVSAIEAEFKIKFQPILRLYMQHISRQHAISARRTCFLSEYNDGWMELSGGLPTDEHLTNNNIPLTRLKLRGPMQGFVWHNIGESLICQEDGAYYCWQTIFERLMRVCPSDLSCLEAPKTYDTGPNIGMASSITVSAYHQFDPSISRLQHKTGCRRKLCFLWQRVCSVLQSASMS